MKYEILGGSLPVLICKLESGESLINESGSMSWMTPNIQMETVGGGVGKMFGKLFSGENLFHNKYTATTSGAEIAFSSSFPGTILAIEVTPNNPIILQKSAFLAATSGVELSVHFNKKAASGFFGGEGFIMQKVSGSGTVFVEIDGFAYTYDLGVGQTMIVDTGNLAMMDSTCTMDIQAVKGVKNMLFGGEGLFNTVVTGPGKVTVQSMPVSGVAAALLPYLPNKGN